MRRRGLQATDITTINNTTNTTIIATTTTTNNNNSIVTTIIAAWSAGDHPARSAGGRTPTWEDCCFILRYVYTSRCVRVILAQGPCKYFPYRSNFERMIPEGNAISFMVCCFVVVILLLYYC